MLQYRAQRIGGLDCVVVEAKQASAPQLAFVVMHGFGATGEDLVPLAEELVIRNESLAGSVRFIFPAAPLQPEEMADYGGRAWWQIDMVKLQRAAMSGDFRDLRAENPPGLPAVRDKVMALIDEVRAETGLPLDRFVLGGFSQGSMLATDVTLRLSSAPGGLVVWSGTLLCESQWVPLMPARKDLPVMQSHGRHDPILPFSIAEQLRSALTSAGVKVDFRPFDGPHTISQGAIDGTVELLKGLLPAAN